MVVYSAPGKIIISGEHAVVYGHPALVSAVGRRLKLTVIIGKKPIKNKIISHISCEVKRYLDEKKIPYMDKLFDYKIDSEIPVGRGMGSSSALSVAGAACFLEFFTGKQFPLNTVSDMAHIIETYFHANSSGVDTAISSQGGLIYYRKEFDFLKSFSHLNFSIPKKIMAGLYLIDTGKPEETTGEMVSLVAMRYNKRPQLTGKLLDKIEETTKTILLSLKENNISLFKKSILVNENLLEKLGVVSVNTKKLLRDIKHLGIGKITGAGGKKSSSGFVLFYSDNPRELLKYCQEHNLKCYKFNRSEKGLTKEL